MTKRNNHTSEYKAKVVLKLLENNDSLGVVASKHGISPGLLSA